jgi:hypothetical protein
MQAPVLILILAVRVEADGGRLFSQGGNVYRGNAYRIRGHNTLYYPQSQSTPQKQVKHIALQK